MAAARSEETKVHGVLRRALEELDRAFELYKRRLRRKVQVVPVSPPVLSGRSHGEGSRQRKVWLQVMRAAIGRALGKIVSWFQ
jgi:hypothetical protein